MTERAELPMRNEVMLNDPQTLASTEHKEENSVSTWSSFSISQEKLLAGQTSDDTIGRVGSKANVSTDTGCAVASTGSPEGNKLRVELSSVELPGDSAQVPPLEPVLKGNVGSRRRPNTSALSTRRPNTLSRPATMAETVTRLTEATLYDQGLLQDVGAYAECAFQQQLEHPVLQSVPLSSAANRVRTRTQTKSEVLLLTRCIRKIRENDKTFHTFHASGEELPGHWLRAVAMALPHNTHLRRINFNGNQAGDRDIKMLAESLATNRAVIEVALGGNNLSSAGVEAIAAMLRTNQTLFTLNVAGKTDSKFAWLHGAPKSITPAGAYVLSAALKANKTLTSLVLSGQKILDGGCAYLAKVLSMGSGLKHLGVAHVSMTDVGAKAFGDALVTNSALLSLDLRKNGVTDDGANGLSAGLKGNTTLTFLDLGGNRVGNAGAHTFFELLASHNPFIKHLSLVDNAAADAAVTQLHALVRKRHSVALPMYSRVPVRTHLDRFKDSGARLLQLRTYGDNDEAVKYSYPRKTYLHYPGLPSADEWLDEPPVPLVVRDNYKARMRQERARSGQGTRYKRWKRGLFAGHGQYAASSEWRASDAWLEWKQRLPTRYPCGIDTRERPQTVPTSSPILELQKHKKNFPRTIRPPHNNLVRPVWTVGSFRAVAEPDEFGAAAVAPRRPSTSWQ